MYVKDIYGTESPFKELQGDLVASSFAKVAFDNEFDRSMKFNGDGIKKYKKEDILNSLVFMISFNIG
jgi:pantothenate kinase